MPDELHFQHRVWRFQRLGWVLMALVVLAALAGASGSGAWSRTRLQSPSGFRLEYDRFSRAQSSLDVLLEVPRSVGERGIVSVTLDARYLARVMVEQVIPQPRGVNAVPEGITYRFAVAAGAGTARLRFHLKAETAGWLRGRVGVGKEPPLEIRQFIYP